MNIMHYRILFVLMSCLLSLQQGTAQKRFDEETRSGYRDGFNKKIKVTDKALNFIVLGDWGRYGAFYQKQVAEEMGRTAAALDPAFILTVGDNFYPNGVQSTTDYQWLSSFEQVYTNFFLQCNWYVTLGNHDYRGNIQAQLDYSKVSRRWRLPANYYSRKIPVNDSEQLLLVVIDTSPYIDAYYRKEDEIGNNVRAQDTAAQRKWLEQTLADKDPAVKWKVVAGHHPLYSGGKRKTSTDTKNIAQRFGPLFEQAKVHAYICGHEHDLQVIRPASSFTTQLLSGAGCEVRPTGNTEGTLFAASKPGFMTCTVKGTQMLVQVVGADGRILYSTMINR